MNSPILEELLEAWSMLHQTCQLSNNMTEILKKTVEDMIVKHGQATCPVPEAPKLSDYSTKPTQRELDIACGTFSQDITPGTNGKLAAVKIMRDRTGLGLLQAKLALEQGIRDMGYDPMSPTKKL